MTLIGLVLLLSPFEGVRAVVSVIGGELIFAIVIALVLILGLLLNTLTFMGVSDILVRGPHNQKNARMGPDGVEAAHQHVDAQILADLNIKNGSDLIASDLNSETVDPKKIVDPEYVILWACDPSRITYIQDKYWFYMEFQINMAIASLVLLLGSMMTMASVGVEKWY